MARAVARGYWPCVFGRMHAGEELIVSDMAQARRVCSSAWRLGYTLWRRRAGERYALTLAHGQRAGTRGRR